MDEIVQMDDSYGRGKKISKTYRVPVVFDKDEARKRKLDSVDEGTDRDCVALLECSSR